MNTGEEGRGKGERGREDGGEAGGENGGGGGPREFQFFLAMDSSTYRVRV